MMTCTFKKLKETYLQTLHSRFLDLVKNKQKEVLVLIFVLAFSVRIMASLILSYDLMPDAVAYRSIGAYFFTTGIIENFKVMPLYPIIAHFSVLLGDFHLLDILISSLTCIILFFLAKEIFGDIVIGFLSAFIFCFYPFSIYYSYSGLTETTFTFLIVCSYLLLYKEKFLIASVCLILSILIRPTTDLLNPILILFFSLFIFKYGLGQSLKNLLGYFFLYLLFLFPWWWHNYQKYGEFVRLNLGFGEMIYGGNNDKNISDFNLTRELNFKFNKTNNLIERNHLMVKEAINTILANKMNFLKKSVHRFFYFWNVIPNHPDHRTNPIFVMISFVSITSLLIGSIYCLWYEFKNKFFLLFPIILFVLYLTFIHSITIASVRYRYPLEPFMIIFLSYTIVHFCKNRISSKIE